MNGAIATKVEWIFYCSDPKKNSARTKNYCRKNRPASAIKQPGSALMPNVFQQHDEHGIEHGGYQHAFGSAVQALVGIVNERNEVGKTTEGKHQRSRYMVG